MGKPLIDVEGARRKRLQRIANLATVAGTATELVDGMGANPTSALTQLAELGRWERLSRSATQRKDVVRRTVTRLGDLTESSEADFYLTQQTLAGRAFLRVDSSAVEDVRAGLVERGIDPKYARRALQGAAAPLDRNFSIAAQGLTAAWTRALRRDAEMNLVRSVADFNLHLAQAASAAQGPQELTSAVTRLRESVIEELSERLRKGQESYIPLSAARGIAVASELLSSAAIPLMASVKQDDHQEAESVGLVAADCTRDLLWLIAVLKNVTWRCLWPHVAGVASLGEAAALPLLAKPPSVRRIDPSGLGRRQASSTKLELAGVVEHVAITHEAKGKPVTRFQVSAADAKFVVQVNGFKADSTGCVPRSFAAFTGEWDDTPVQVEGEKYPGRLVVSRQSITEERTASFEGYLRWLTSPIYLSVPHGLAIRSTWVAGAHGPLNPFRYAVTARKR